MTEPSILLLAGEASGDYHAAAMVRDLKQLRPGMRFCGIGGDKLAREGMKLFFHYSEINTIGLGEGLGKARKIVRAYNKMKTELKTGPHKLFIPVDFPDVNLRLSRIAKKAGIPVCYFISPQVWAWRKGRIATIAERVDRLMTIFPFEEELYFSSGLRVDFVGHTMTRDIPGCPDRVQLRLELGAELDRPSIALVPGSRQSEVRRILPTMCEAAVIYLDHYPDTHFLLPLAGTHLTSLVNDILSSFKLPVRVCGEEAWRVMGACDSGLVTSGTATLQAALVGLPHAVVYKLDKFSWLLATKILKPLVMDQDIHVAMANVLAIKSEKKGPGLISEMIQSGFQVDCKECGRPLLVPELLQGQASPANLAHWLIRFRSEDGLRSAMRRGFDQVRAMLTPKRNGPTPASVVNECLQARESLPNDS